MPEQALDEACSIALRAIAWIMSDPTRAQRLLAVTGLSPDALRARIGEPALLAAALGFLEAHEADLVACAESIGIAPAAMVRAREALER